MPYTLFQGGSSLQVMDTAGVLTTLTLPTGVVVDSTKTPRMTVFGRYAVVTNSVSRPITVDPEFTVRVLTPLPPRTTPVLTNTNGGNLSGTYKIKQTFVTLDEYKQIIAESDFGEESLAVAITTDYLTAQELDRSSEDVTATRLYRTATLGDTFFRWLDIDGNTQVSVSDDLADVDLETAAAPILGTPPQLTIVASYRDRLWGVGDLEVDDLRYTEAQKMYAWPTTNRIPIQKIGSDDRGITGILARRDALAVARTNSLVQITGNSNDTFRQVVLSSEVGVEGTDTIAQFRDTIYFLWKDGVYTWDNGGINCISDGKVRKWFNSDTYFNRSRFKYAVGRVDPLTNKYQLLLSAAGSTSLDRWVEFDIKDRTWWGPHKTDAFTPTWMGLMVNSSGVFVPVHCSSTGHFWQEQDTRTDDTATGIALDVDGKFHDMGTPDIMKFFGQLSLISKTQAAGTLSILPYVGDLDVSAGTTISADMTLDRQRLVRLGIGQYCKLVFQHSTVAQDIELFGYEVPFHEVGRR